MQKSAVVSCPMSMRGCRAAGDICLRVASRFISKDLSCGLWSKCTGSSPFCCRAGRESLMLEHEEQNRSNVSSMSSSISCTIWFGERIRCIGVVCPRSVGFVSINNAKRMGSSQAPTVVRTRSECSARRPSLPRSKSCEPACKRAISST